MKKITCLFIYFISICPLFCQNNIDIVSTYPTIYGLNFNNNILLNLIKGHKNLNGSNVLDDDHILSSTIISTDNNYSYPRIVSIIPNTQSINFDKLYYSSNEKFISTGLIHDNVNDNYINIGYLEYDNPSNALNPKTHPIYLSSIASSGTVNWCKKFDNIAGFPVSITTLKNIPSTSSIYNLLNVDKIAYAIVGYTDEWPNGKTYIVYGPDGTPREMQKNVNAKCRESIGFVILVNSTGDILWTKSLTDVIANPLSDCISVTPRKVIEIPNKGIYITGGTSTIGFNCQSTAGGIMKYPVCMSLELDYNGNMIFQNSFTEPLFCSHKKWTHQKASIDGKTALFDKMRKSIFVLRSQYNNHTITEIEMNTGIYISQSFFQTENNHPTRQITFNDMEFDPMNSNILILSGYELNSIDNNEHTVKLNFNINTKTPVGLSVLNYTNNVFGPAFYHQNLKFYTPNVSIYDLSHDGLIINSYNDAYGYSNFRINDLSSGSCQIENPTFNVATTPIPLFEGFVYIVNEVFINSSLDLTPYSISSNLSTSCDDINNMTKMSAGINGKSIEDVNDINFSPNPTKDATQLIGVGLPNGNYTVNIKNLLGQTVYLDEIKITNNQIDLKLDVSKFANGEYLVNIANDSETIVRKLQVIK